MAVDRINDLIILQVDSVKRKPIELFPGKAPNSAKTSYISASSGKTIQIFTGKLLNQTNVKGARLYRITNRIRKATFGMPVFVSNKKTIGHAFSDVANYQTQSFAIPSSFIAQLLSNKNSEVVSEMDVVDEIEKVETDRQWRPVKDIRLKNIRILK